MNIPGPRVFAVGMVKDEADIIAATILNLLCWGIEQVIVADNESTDDTVVILERLKTAMPGRVVVLHDRDPAYYQARKMTALANYAGDFGADWVIPFDADELWGLTAPAPLQWSIPAALEQVDSTALWVKVGMKNHYCTDSDNQGETDPTKRMRWRHTDPNPLVKVAFRWRPGVVIGMGNHEITFPAEYGDQPGVETLLEIRHFPYRSEEQFVRKARNGAAAYAATDLDEMYGAHWRGYGQILDSQGEEALRDVFREHFYYPHPAESGVMTYDPAPLPPGLWLA